MEWQIIENGNWSYMGYPEVNYVVRDDPGNLRKLFIDINTDLAETRKNLEDARVELMAAIKEGESTKLFHRDTREKIMEAAGFVEHFEWLYNRSMNNLTAAYEYGVRQFRVTNFSYVDAKYGSCSTLAVGKDESGIVRIIYTPHKNA